MKTSSYFTYPKTGAGRIAISRSVPRGYPGGYRIYKLLAPGPWFREVEYKEYRRRYFEQLASLEASKVANDLQRLAGEGVEPVLLCFEREPFDKKNYCHRHMVAEWFQEELGVEVLEWDSRNNTPSQ